MTTLLDGGLATTLQRQGLPPDTPLDDWIVQHPDRIEAVQRAFVDAGSRILLTPTLRALPHLDPRWPQLVDQGVALSLRASSDRADVWLSVGPASTAQRPWRALSEPERLALAPGWIAVAWRSLRRGVAGIVLETFTDPDEAWAATRAIRRSFPGVPLITSLCPGPDGRFFDGREPAPAVRRLLEQAPTGVGFNCGTGPASVERALDRCEGIEARWWAKPARGESDDTALVASLQRLAQRCDWVGGCCGVGPEVIAKLA